MCPIILPSHPQAHSHGGGWNTNIQMMYKWYIRRICEFVRLVDIRTCGVVVQARLTLINICLTKSISTVERELPVKQGIPSQVW